MRIRTLGTVIVAASAAVLLGATTAMADPAAPLPNPQITAGGGNLSVWATGTNFTPNGTVHIIVWRACCGIVQTADIHALSAHKVCFWGPPFICSIDPGGEFSYSTSLPRPPSYDPCAGPGMVGAEDVTTGTWSNWVTVDISC